MLNIIKFYNLYFFVKFILVVYWNKNSNLLFCIIYSNEKNLKKLFNSSFISSLNILLYLLIRNTTDSTKILTASLPERAVPSGVSFNPSDWRQLAFLYSGDALSSASNGEDKENPTGVWLGAIEQCDKSYTLRKT